VEVSLGVVFFSQSSSSAANTAAHTQRQLNAPPPPKPAGAAHSAMPPPARRRPVLAARATPRRPPPLGAAGPRRPPSPRARRPPARAQIQSPPPAPTRPQPSPAAAGRTLQTGPAQALTDLLGSLCLVQVAAGAGANVATGVDASGATLPACAVSLSLPPGPVCTTGAHPPRPCSDPAAPRRLAKGRGNPLCRASSLTLCAGRRPCSRAPAAHCALRHPSAHHQLPRVRQHHRHVHLRCDK
jgi:hypothetical protein